MLHKIQKYLLLNYPLLWNIRIVPVLGFAVVINIAAFLIGYFGESIDFTSRYYYDQFASSGFTYFGIGVASLLTLIVWLIFYSKNSAFKSFYPQKSTSLYFEWIMIFVIVLSIILPFLTFHTSSIVKQRSYASKAETIKAVETLNMVKMLIPSDKTAYYKEYPNEETTNMYRKNTTTPFDSLLILAESQNVYYEYYPNFTQLSLLNYSGYSPIYVSEDYDLKLKDYQDVQKMLVKQDKAAISQLMDDFLKLQAKHGLKSNLTKDIWLKLIYNPAKYPVGDFNLMSSYNTNFERETEDYSSRYNYKYYGDPTNNIRNYYVQYDELESAYREIFDAHMEPLVSPIFLLVLVCIALGLSLLIFSYRVTSGKAWLIAFVAAGVILFINSVFSFAPIILGADFGVFSYMFVLLVLFIVEVLMIISKNQSMSSKGKSNIYISHVIWALPAVPVILFIFVYTITKTACYDTVGADYLGRDENALSCRWYDFMDKNIAEFVWGNICLTFATMWLFIRYVLLKWKSLPEE